MALKLLVSALEPSSNLHLKHILPHLDCELCGIFDKDLGPAIYDFREFSVMGIFDILPKIFKAKEAINELVFLAKDSDKILLIDAPAFNLPLAKAIKKSYPNKEVIYYILPKVWVWKKHRVRLVEKYVDKIVSIFPFEKKYYKNSLYFGNPLLDEIKYFKEKLSVNNKIAFLPGSRKKEIKYLMPIYKELRKNKKEESLLVIPPFFDDSSIKELYGDISSFTVLRDARQALYESDFAYVCSGTATLEAALIGTPFVLVYKISALEFFLANLLINFKQAGLANIIFSYSGLGLFHQEFLQGDCTFEKLLNVNVDKEDFLARSKILRNLLEKGGLKDLAKLIMD